MQFFFVQSGKNFTGQNLFTQAPPVVPVTNMRYGRGYAPTYDTCFLLEFILHCFLLLLYLFVCCLSNEKSSCRSEHFLIHILLLPHLMSLAAVGKSVLENF